MKYIAKRITAALLVVSSLMIFPSCGSKSSSEAEKKPNMVGQLDGDVDIAAEDMPVGSSTIIMTEEAYDIPMSVEYIDGYITQEEGKMISNYFAAISSKDGDLLAGCYYEPYFDAYIKKQDIADSKEYAESCYNYLKGVIGEDFEFNYVVIDAREDDPDFGAYTQMLEAAAPEAKVTSKKMLLAEVYGETDSTSSMWLTKRRDGEAFPVCIYVIDGKSYIM